MEFKKDDIEEIFSERMKWITEVFQTDIDNILKFLKFNFQVYEILERKLSEKTESLGHPFETPKENYPPLLFFRNCHYLYSISLSFNKGFINPGYANLRTVLESIYYIYFTALSPDEIVNQFESYRYNEIKQLGIIVPDSEYDIYDKKTMRKVRHKFSTYQICQNFLYNEGTLEEKYSTYRLFCQQVHSTLVNIQADFHPNEESTKLFLHYYYNLFFTNISSIFEIYHNSYFKDEYDYFHDILHDISKSIGDGTVPNYCPDRDELNGIIKHSKYLFIDYYK